MRHSTKSRPGRLASSRIIGILMILSSVLLNKWSLGQLVSQDGYIESSFLQASILATQIFILLAGLWLFFRRKNVNWSRLFRLGLTLARSFGASSLQQEMGVGGATIIKEIEVYWPTSNTRQCFKNVDIDQVIEITEGAETYGTVQSKRIKFSNPTSMIKKIKLGD